jgi:hypothetical protein
MLFMTSFSEPFSKVAFLLSANPMGLTEKDKMGRLPLHVFVTPRFTHVQHAEMLRLLLNSFPSASNIRNLQGFSPLYLAISNTRFLTATILLEEHVGDIDCTCIKSCQPFFLLALQNGAPYAFLRLLMQRAPECLKMKNPTSGDSP